VSKNAKKNLKFSFAFNIYKLLKDLNSKFKFFAMYDTASLPISTNRICFLKLFVFFAMRVSLKKTPHVALGW
jgi:hypothetical protein